MRMNSATALRLWAELKEHYESVSPKRMQEMFASDPTRASRFTIESPELLLDFSKNRITDTTLELLVSLASAVGVSDQIQANRGGPMVRNRHDLLAAIRACTLGANSQPAADIDGVAWRDVVRLFNLMNDVFSGDLLGPTGKPIRTVVTIATASTCSALRLYSSTLGHPGAQSHRRHFLSAFGDARVSESIGEFDPEESLFVVVWHGDYEDEVTSNVTDVIEWLNRIGLPASQVASQFVLLSTKGDPGKDLGISTENVFQLMTHRADRFAIWSLVGMTTISYLGKDHFEALLSGASSIDDHFVVAPLASNIPVVLALLGVWYANFFQAGTIAIFPYAKELAELVSHLQHVHMVGSGHRITRSGDVVSYETSPIVWGGTGTESQYTMMEILHRHARLVPCDFIAVAASNGSRSKYDSKLFAECVAQSAKLMSGSTSEELLTALRPHGLELLDPRWRLAESAFPGNQPSNTIMLNSLGASSLGALLACYEHKIDIQQLIWNV